MAENVTATNGPRRCEAQTKAGQRCGGFAQTGRPYCFMHDPERAADRNKAQARGGRAKLGRRLQGAAELGGLDLDTPSAALAVVGAALRDLAGLENSVARGRAILYGAGLILKAYEQAELEARLTELEKRIEDLSHDHKNKA